MIKLIKKYDEIIRYLIIGVLTTIVSISSFYLFNTCIHIYYLISDVLSWIISIIFAFIMNKIFVFKSKNKSKDETIYEFVNFTKYRILSLLIDMFIMFIFISIFKIDELISKIFVQFVVVVLNYIFSKFFVFKKN